MQMMRVGNPLEVAQTLEFLPGSRYVIEPHGTCEIPSVYRPAIWARRCEELECHRAGPAWCQRGHKTGIVVGGMAPLLTDEGDIQ